MYKYINIHLYINALYIYFFTCDFNIDKLLRLWEKMPSIITIMYI